MDFLGARVHLNPRPAQPDRVALEVAMLGHCPGEVRIDRLLNLSNAAREIRLAGYGEQLDQRIAENDNLYHLPIPLRSLAEFEDIFPQARTQGTQYQSTLAGKQAWLPKAVDDFFANGGEKLWVVQIPEGTGVTGFLPPHNSALHDTENLQGLFTVLVLSAVGIVAMPDLERIQIAQNLPDIPRMRLSSVPQFLPCGRRLDDDHRERRGSAEMVGEQSPFEFLRLLRRLLDYVNRHRSDMQCLITLPLTYSHSLQSPRIDDASLDMLNESRTQPGAYLLRQAQLLFPYLRSSQYSLYSPTGVIAGALARSARSRGIWRSIAWQPLITDGHPYPAVNQVQKLQLREDPGIGVLQQRQGRVQLDDERIMVPAFHRNDYNAGDWSERLKSLRSAEVVRFIGFLKRQLQELGETLIFSVDYRDPRPRLLLEKLFNKLFEQGALRGARPEQAYSIRQSHPQEGVISIDIEIAPAYPIDKIALTFVNRDGSWLTEAKHG